ncbi:hypothetical protein [Actinophytocola sp.]|uniref:hypothetical protein n=1 Tax=Actinophytocola sp. TaxID=1872138 RepID=UPI002D420D65|nr:hypothetical protein [Actinophytocola sp.]HYQ63729.1 hypothetical protein [Actinophytocola sp.]
MKLRRTLGAACLSALGMALMTVPAHAAPGDATAADYLSVPAQAAPGDAIAAGHAGTTKVGQVTVPSIAPCSTEGRMQATKSETTVADVVTYSNNKSVCTIDGVGEIATVTVTGGRYRFDALIPYGGPRIRLASFTARCETTLTGSRSTLQFTGLSGIQVPSRIPKNYVVTIPGGPGGKPKATVTFNEVITPSPPNGSMTVHLMHIRMFPAGGPTTGDSYVGTVFCSPVS